LEEKKAYYAIRKKSCFICGDLHYLSLEPWQIWKPRIVRELESKGIRASRPFVAKLMRERGLRSIVKKKFKKTTNSSHRYPVVENYLNQNFQVKSSKEVWVSDITYIRTGQGWLYLTTVIDLYDRKVIGWSLSETMKAQDTSIAALKMARLHRPLQDQDNLIFHSDRGIQYAYRIYVNSREKHYPKYEWKRKLL
jgi:transposase InsO family protein